MIDIRFEPLSYLLLNGLPNLAFQAWNELEEEHNDVPHNPDWDAYQNLETKNILRFVAMRDSGNLIGYASIIIDNDLHRIGLTMGIGRDIYVAAGKRGHAAKLIRFIVKNMTMLDVNDVLIGERVTSNNNAGDFYKALGFTHRENIYGKTIN